MILSVTDQVIVFLWTTVCGMAAAFIYDLFRILRKAVKTGDLVTFVQDVLYWLIAAVIMSVTIFYSNDGELRGFLFLGAFIGVVLYALMLSHIIMSSSLFIIRVTVKMIRFLSFIASYPFRMIVKLLAIPVRKLADISAAEIRKAGDRRRASKERARVEKASRAAARKEKANRIRVNKTKAKDEQANKEKSNMGTAKKGKSVFINRIFTRSKRKNAGKRAIKRRFEGIKKDF